jgi:hypothetical protein
MFKVAHATTPIGRNNMSNTSTIITVLAGFIGSAGTGVATLIKQAAKYEAKFESYIAHAEYEINTVLDELNALQAKVEALVPAPAPAPSKAVAKKAPAKRLR